MEIELRDYQKEAIEKFYLKEKGVLDMATGTGKTFTAISILNESYYRDGRQFLIIVVPTIALLNQWIEELGKFGIKNYISIEGKNRRWRYQLKDYQWNYKQGITDRVIAIGTYNSIGSSKFNEVLSDNIPNSFLVADECHNIGLEKFNDSKLLNFDYRLGLSATPEKWRDVRGNHIIKKYFPETILNYSLDKAIEEDMLVDYNYFPIIVNFDDEEMENFAVLSLLIGFCMSEEPVDHERLEALLRKRSMIVKRASMKKTMLVELLKEKDEIKPSIIYCAPGQEEEIIELLYGLGIKASRYTSKMDLKTRENALEMFSKREIDMLVAIKCLDEGVDIPLVKNAYILASTSNPREFIQRRGRVLRKHEDKNYANIYDFIVLDDSYNDSTFESLARIEMPRFAEFSDLAINKYSSRAKIKNILSLRNLEYLMDEKPQNVVFNEMETD